MLRRRAEEMKAPSGEMEEEDGGTLLQSSQLQADSPNDKKKQQMRSAGGEMWAADGSSWTPTWVLLGLIAFLYMTIWTLPAPTFFGKLGLLRQSWRINAVLDESEELRVQLSAIQKTHTQFEQDLTAQDLRSKELQRRLDASGGETKSLRQQVADEQVMVSGLHSSSSALEADFQKQKERRLDLLHKLQHVKTAELKDLQALDVSPDAATTSVAQAGLTTSQATTTSLSKR